MRIIISLACLFAKLSVSDFFAFSPDRYIVSYGFNDFLMIFGKTINQVLILFLMLVKLDTLYQMGIH